MIVARLESLRVALATKGGDRLTTLVEAFIAPVIRLRTSTEGEYYALLMARGLALQFSIASRWQHTFWRLRQTMNFD